MDSERKPPTSNRGIYLAALEIVDERERDAFVAQACAGDPERRHAMERLLEARRINAANRIDRATEQFAPLGTGAEEPSYSNDFDVATHPTIDRYKLLEQIGEGGMGSVFMAQQTQPVKRKVALKLIKSGMDSREVIARFEAERQALAMMEHPNIASVLDAGTTAEGRPYFVMELVRGIPITEYCDNQCVSIEDRLRLFIDVCRAVQHAHQKGIIHRDLKPSNVMVTLHDGTPVVKVIDFGVAKALNQELTERTLFTQFSQMIGTPLYMSPEQAEMTGLDIDTRSDVYTLGVLLYELLTGTTPFDKEKLSKASFDDMRRIIREEEPSRPSLKISTLEAQLLSTVSSRRKLDPRQLALSMRRELDWIAMKALEKDRNRRYESASALAADVERYLSDDPVQACPPSTRYRLAKVVRRHKGALMTASLIVTSLLAGIGVSLWQAARAIEAEDLAQARFLLADEATRSERTARQQAEQLTDETRRLLSHSYVTAGEQRLVENDLARSLPWFVEALAVDAGDDNLEFVHRTRIGMVLQQCPKLVAVFQIVNGEQRPAERMRGAVFDRNDRAIAVRTNGRVAQVHDVLTGEPIGPASTAQRQVSGVQLSPKGRYLYVASGTGFVLVEVGSGRVILEDDTTVSHSNSCFSHDETRLAVLPIKGKGQIWDTETGRPIASPTVPAEVGDRLNWAEMSHDGSQVLWAAGHAPAAVGLWNRELGTRSAVLTEHERFIYDARFSHDGKRLVTASFDTTARVFDVDTLAPIGLPLDHDDYVQAARFSPDDSAVITVSGDHTARLWDAETGEPLTPLLLHDGEVKSAAFSRDGRYVITASWDTTARIWEAATGKLAYPLLTHHAQVAHAKFDSTGRRAMTITTDGLVHLWDLAGGTPPGVVIDDVATGFFPEFTSDGKSLLVSGSEARLWDVETGQPLSPPMRHDDGTVTSATFSSQEDRIATLNGYGSIRVWDSKTFQPITPLLRHDWETPHKWEESSASFGPQDRKVLALFRHPSNPRSLRIWDTDTGDSLAWPVTQTERVVAASFSPDGRFIATGSATRGALRQQGGALTFWDGRDGTMLRKPILFADPVTAIAISRDSRSVATTSGVLHSGVAEIRVFDVATGELLGPPILLRTEFHGVDFSPDGRRILTVSRDQTARIWEVGSGKPLTPPMYHKERVHFARFSPDGRFVLTTAGVDNLNSQGPANARLWDADTGKLVTPPLRHSNPFQIVSSGSFSPDGQRFATASRDQTTRIWTISSETHPPKDLELLSQVLSSRKLDSHGSLSTVSSEEKQIALKYLQSHYPEWFTATEQQVSAWRHREAVHAHSTRRWREALSHLTQLIDSLGVANTGVHYRRSQCAVELREWAIAASDLQAIMASCRGYSYAQYQAALAALGAEDREQYRTLCQDLLNDVPDTTIPNVATFAAWTMSLAPESMEDYGPAIALARRSLDLGYDTQIALTSLGALLLRAGDCEASLPYLTAAAIAAEDAGQSPVYAWYFLALAHHGLGDDQQAKDWLDQALAQTSKQFADAESAGGEPLPWNRRLTLELLRGEIGAAVRTEQANVQAIQSAVTPRFNRGHGDYDTVLFGDRSHQMFLAMAHWQLGNEATARDVYAEAAAWIASGSKGSEEHERLRDETERLLGLSQSDRDKLVADYYTTTEITDAPTLANRGHWYQANGDFEKAVEDFTKAINLRQDSQVGVLWRSRGLAYHAIQEYELAINDLSKTLERDPNDCHVRKTRGMALHSLGQLDMALAELSRCIETEPSVRVHYPHRARIYVSLGDFESALADYQTAIDIDPQNDEQYFRRADAYAHRGDIYANNLQQYAQAVEAYSKALGLDSQNAAIAEKLDRAIQASEQPTNAASEEPASIAEPRLSTVQ